MNISLIRSLIHVTVLLLLASWLSLSSGCVPLIGVAAISAVDIAHDRRSVGNYVDDGSIEIQGYESIIRDDSLRGTTHISVTSMNGIVLLTGEAPTTELRQRAVAHVNKVAEVRQVVNEIQLAGKSTFPSRLNDTWITGKVKTNLFSAYELDATRVKVVTEYGTVYLMGLVTQTEGASAAQSARTVKGVSRVVKVFEYLD